MLHHPNTSEALVIGCIVEQLRRAGSGPVPLRSSARSRQAGRHRLESGADRVGLAVVPCREGQKVARQCAGPLRQGDSNATRNRASTSALHPAGPIAARTRSRTRPVEAGGADASATEAPAAAWISAGGSVAPSPSQRAERSHCEVLIGRRSHPPRPGSAVPGHRARTSSAGRHLCPRRFHCPAGTRLRGWTRPG